MEKLNIDKRLIVGIETKTIKHISFDVWSTLILGNKAFKPFRTKYFFENYNPKKLTEDEINQIISKIDKTWDTVADMTWFGFQSKQLYGMILLEMWVEKSVIANDLEAIYEVFEKFILQNPPRLYEENTIKILRWLVREWYTLSILSNTWFMRWTTLSKVMDLIWIWELLSYRLFSDQLWVSKPNPVSFQAIHEYAGKIHHEIKPNEILHVWDNPVADYQWAIQFWMTWYIINSNSNTISDLQHILLQWKI